MDIRWVIFFALAIVLIVAFGSNPMGVRVVDTRSPEYFKAKLERELVKQKSNPYGQASGGLFPGVGVGSGTGPAGLPGLPGAQPTGRPTVGTTPITGAEGTATPAYYLKDGRRIFFTANNQIMLLSGDGQLTPLPDGEYEMQSGDKIYVRDGQRVAAPAN